MLVVAVGVFLGVATGNLVAGRFVAGRKRIQEESIQQ